MLDETSMETNENFYQIWSKRINEALKREEDYRKSANRFVKIYECAKAELTPFNIVYSNVETLSPAVYNAVPIPVVTRRYKDPDPVGKVAAEVSTRLLKYLIQDESEDCDTFDEIMQANVLDGLVTNRGLSRYKYETYAENGETVAGENVRWDKFFHGYARTWKKVPFIGFEWDMTLQELRKNFPDVTFDDIRNYNNDIGEDMSSEPKRQDEKGVTLYKVFEIWDKTEKKVFFISPIYKKGALRMVEDPLELKNFYPIPKPLNFTRKISSLIPTPFHEMYNEQAQELNELTRRIKNIIKAMKVRGMYNAEIEGIEQILTAEDNTFVPLQNIASMPDGSSIDKMLWFMPLQELSTTVQNLYVQREQIKQVIYEITGVSDILRGASVASETATAQNIKNQWGSLRLRKMQKEVQRYCRDALALTLEIAVTLFSPQTVAAMTGMSLLFKADKDAITQALQASGTQPSEPPPPEVQKAMELPTWEEVLEVLKNDKTRSYKVDIETNSTIDAEAAQDKQDIAELLNAISQFLNGVAPLVEKQLLPFNLAKEMLLAVTRRYTFGSQLEDALQAMQPPPPPQEGPDPSEMAKMEQIKAETQATQAETQAKAQLMQIEIQTAKDMAEIDQRIRQAEAAVKLSNLKLKEREAELKLDFMIKSNAVKLKGIVEQGEAKKAAKQEPREKEDSD